MEYKGDIILFDGVCNLCTASVQFTIARDPQERFAFASLQSEIGGRLARENGINPTRLNSVVLIQNGHAYTRSGAALRVCRHLKWPWPLLALLLGIPAALRDPAYRLIARYRYRLFGRRRECWLPDRSLSDRFLD